MTVYKFLGPHALKQSFYLFVFAVFTVFNCKVEVSLCVNNNGDDDDHIISYLVAITLLSQCAGERIKGAMYYSSSEFWSPS